MTNGAVGSDDPRGVATSKDLALLKTSQLECMVGNNKSYVSGRGQHRAGYNGLFWLTSTMQAESPFVPAYSGLNLEHYFDERHRDEREVFFEPRHAELSLTQTSATSAVLHQPPTPTFGVESWTTFQLCEPYYVDFTFRCVARRRDEQRSFLGVFWASYINGPIDKSLYFLDAESNPDEPLWRQLCTQEHNRDSSVVGHSDDLTVDFERPGETLFSSFSPLRYASPFFYGRFRNMVLLYVFRPDPHLRFTHSPSGGGANRRAYDTNPAWDFHWIVPKIEVDQPYELAGRLVYKPWKDRDDVLSEVARFRRITSK